MLNTIEQAIKDLKSGKLIIVVDDESRENEGDLIVAAEKADSRAINFMARFGRGLICMPMENKRLRELDINPMTQKNEDVHETAFTVSVDAREGTTTGISASDRAKTVKALINLKTKPQDLTRP